MNTTQGLKRVSGEICVGSVVWVCRMKQKGAASVGCVSAASQLYHVLTREPWMCPTLSM